MAESTERYEGARNESVSYSRGNDSTLKGNYPPPNDTTSEGGSGGDAFSKGSQLGLVEQSLNGGSLEDEVKDVKQGSDVDTRRAYQHEQARDSLNPYNESSWESRNDANQSLASQMNDSRGRQYESGGASSLENDGNM